MQPFSGKSLACLSRERIAPRRRVLLRAMGWAAALLFAAAPSLIGQRKPTEYQVEAAYLYNFGRFVEWPTNSAATKANSFTVCVLGEDPFGATLDATLKGETIAGKSVVAKRISDPLEGDSCQILFLSAGESGRLNKIVEGFNKKAVLTVSDIPRFSERGGMIQFVREGDRIRFEVNLTAAQRAGLSISSELLKVAKAVRGNPAGGD